MEYFLGIDGGGTNTNAAVCDDTGEIILTASGKTINFYSVGMEEARFNLRCLIERVRKACPDGKTFDGVFIGCSALDGDADEETLNALCGGIVCSKAIGMSSDVYVALRASNSNCVAICGTGSMVIGERNDGSIAVKGGWGHTVGDEGSAYSIAVNALKRCCIMHDRGEKTPLLRSAEDFFGVSDFRDAIDKIYGTYSSKDAVARFAKNVAELAENGCEVSRKIISDEARAFGETVITLLKEINGSPMLMLYGGVFQHNEYFTEEFMKKVREAYPLQNSMLLDIPPEVGAARIARSLYYHGKA